MPTFENLITPEGVVIAAGLITGLVQLLKTSFPIIDARISGASMAFVLSAVLYVVAAWALTSNGVISGADGFLAVFMAWLAAATSAVGIKSSFDHATGTSSKNPVTDAIPPDGPQP